MDFPNPKLDSPNPLYQQWTPLNSFISKTGLSLTVGVFKLSMLVQEAVLVTTFTYFQNAEFIALLFSGRFSSTWVTKEEGRVTKRVSNFCSEELMARIILPTITLTPGSSNKEK